MLQNKYLYLFLVSMLPVVELRGGVPMGAAFGLPFWQVYLICVFGNLLPVPFLLFFAKVLVEKLSKAPIVGSFFQWIITKGENKAAKIGSAEKIGLILFVAIPLPGTGAWTGSLVASILRMRRWPAFWCIFAGVLISGFIMGFISYGATSLIGLLSN